MSEFNGYLLSRNWFDFCFENPEKIKPVHTALYFFCIDLCNRLGWKKKFGLPTAMTKEAIGIKSYNSYKKTLNDLIDFGFIKMIETSKNQYSSNVISLTKHKNTINNNLDASIKMALPNKKEIIEKKSAKPKKKKYGNYKHVLLSDEEVDRLKNDYGEKRHLQLIEDLDRGIQLKGYKYKDHNLAIRTWNPINKEKEQTAKEIASEYGF